MNLELPQRVTLPPESLFEGGHSAGYWKYVRGTVAALAPLVQLEYSDNLGKRGWSGFEIRVDDEPVVIDYSDFHIVNPISGGFAHWLRFHHTPAFMPYPNLGSFPPWSFWDWDDYERGKNGPRYAAQRDSIVYRHSALGNRLPNLVRRRTLAMEILTRHCGPRLKTGFIAQQDYFRDCLESLAVVHIPGSHPHILDRTVQQMFAFGVCVISPDLWSTCLEYRPQAGLHYVGIRDDFSDLADKVDWVTQNRQQAIEIGNAARQFFATHCTPHAIWRYVHRRIVNHRAKQAASNQPADDAAAVSSR